MRVYKILCVWMVLAIALMGLAPAASAQAPQGLTKEQHAPPRPDLRYKLQEASLGRDGFKLDAALGAEEAETAYDQYVSQKLGQGKPADGLVGGVQGGASLAAAPTIDRAMVALVNYSDLAYNNIPKPSTENNTDYWVESFNRTHYATMLFSETNQWSMRRYFREASDYGGGVGYDLQGDIHDWTTLPGTAAQYGNDAATGVDNDATDSYDLTDLVEDAADTLATWTPTGGWAAYTSDTSSPYLIDYFIVVHAGKGQEAGGGALGDNAVWSTSGSLASPHQIGTTGYWVQNFVVVAEDTPVGVFAHEMGHLFGLPDTWNQSGEYEDVDWPRQDTGGSGEASPSFYDVMANGCWLGRPLGTRPASMTSWERIQLEWLSPAVWDLSMMPASVYLSQLETPSAANKALKIELPTRTYLSPYQGSWMRSARTNDPSIGTHILGHTFDLAGVSQASIRFRQWYDLKPGVDVAYLELNSGAGFTPIVTYTGKSSGWVQQEINLSAYLGQTISLRWRMEHDTNYYGGLGWFLDYVKLYLDNTVTWLDDFETSDLGPGQGSATLNFWAATDFPRTGALTATHYYLAEWRNDRAALAGFDVGLNEAYNMTDLETGKAEYFRYNPGLLVWYVNELFQQGDNDVAWHPGEGFLLAIDSHPDPLLQALPPGVPWRTRVQMQDATFRHEAATYQNVLTDSGGASNTIGPLPATTFFWDRYASYPYWKPAAPDNSAKTLQYGVRLDVEGENPDTTGATIAFSIDAGNMETSLKTVDKATATPGEVLQYTIVLSNTGIADALTIVVSDTAPAHSTYITGSYNVVGSPAWTITENRGIRWQGTVPLSQPVTITFQVQLDPVIDDQEVVENVAHVYEGTVPEVDLYARTTINSQPCLTSSTKTSSPTSELAGGVVTYTIALENTGNSNANAEVTDCIPQCTTYVDGSLQYNAGSGFYNSQTNCIEWAGPVPAQIGPSAYITFQVKINEGQIPCTLITNRATIDDGYHPSFDIGANTTVKTGPNLVESRKTVSKSVAAPGERLDYSIYVHNGGNQSASVLLTDLIPANTSYVSGSLAYSGGTGSYGSSAINWSGSVPVASSAWITFSVMITNPLTSGTIVTNTAPLRVGSDIYTRTVTTTVLSEPRLTNSTKEVASDSVGYGGTLTYTITLLNDGTQDASVTLSDPIPSGAEYRPGSLSYSAGSGSDGGGSGPITWSGDIAAGTSVTLSFEVSITIAGTGIITNVATVDDGIHAPFNLYATSYVAAVQATDPTGTYYCGDTFQVPVKVFNVNDMQGFEITVDYDPAILQITSIQEHTWFAPAAWTIKTYDNISGTSTVAATLLSQPTGKAGSGTLYYLNFKAIGSGTSAISITHSLLSDSPSPAFTPIPHNEIDGSVTIGDRLVTGRAYMQGRTDHSGATLWSGTTSLGTTAADGSYSFCPPVGYGQNFTLKIVKDGYLYGQKLVAVSMTGTISLSDLTLLGGDPIGSQVSVASPLTCTTPVTMTVAGPPDSRVNVLDLTFVGARFGKTNVDSDWGPDSCHPDYLAFKSDINEDDNVNIFDLVLVGNNFGKLAPSPWP